MSVNALEYCLIYIQTHSFSNIVAPKSSHFERYIVLL